MGLPLRWTGGQDAAAMDRIWMDRGSTEPCAARGADFSQGTMGFRGSGEMEFALIVLLAVAACVATEWLYRRLGIWRDRQ